MIFTQRLRDKFTLESQLKYFFRKLTLSKSNLNVNLKNSWKIAIRPSPAMNGVIEYEILVNETYKFYSLIDFNSLKLIVDIGANIGYSCIYWLNYFPNSRISVFKPHPKHVIRINEHTSINGASNRVQLIASAAGTEVDSMYLTDKEGHSQVLNSSKSNSIPISVVDWFEVIGNEPIDILKVDIEGGEYPLLGDSLFANLTIKALVMEWYSTSQYPDGYSWCINGFKKLNYSAIGEKEIDSDCGVLFAFPNSM